MTTKTPIAKKDPYRASRISYIIEAALEYFISLLITDAFLATLLTRTGVPDAATGIITQIASLSFAAQLISVFYRKRKGVKRFVTVMHLLNQLMYVSLYFIPGLDFPQWFKVAAFVVMFSLGHLIASAAQPYKLTWLMSHVPDKSRGVFTANKEIISLLGGMVFSFVMGSLVDHYEAIGKEDTGFMLCGITIFALAILHLITLIIVKEKPEHASDTKKVGFVEAIRNTFSNKALFKITLVDILWHICTGIAISFYGVYKTNDLGFSLKLVATLVAVRSITRALMSRYFGHLADKYSWAKMLAISFGFAGLSFLVNTFATPANGVYIFVIYECLYGISMAGINSGLMNITFDYVPHEDRAAALGVKYAVGGFTSFFAALVGAVIVDNIQGAGNRLFGMEIYAQQVLSLIAAIITGILVLYIVKVIFNLKKEEN